jgi:hypothetical protein
MISIQEMAAFLLQPDEREAVLGDLTESGADTWNAFCSVLGLMVRQQLEPWRSWQPWLASCVALAGSLLLLGVSFGLSMDLSALLRHGDIRRTLAFEALLMPAWAWTSGFMVGSLSRRTRWMSAALCATPCLSCVLRFHDTSISRFCVLLFVAPAVLGAVQGMRRVVLQPSTAIALAAAVTGLVLAWNGLYACNWLLLLPAWWLVVTAKRFDATKQEMSA